MIRASVDSDALDVAAKLVAGASDGTLDARVRGLCCREAHVILDRLVEIGKSADADLAAAEADIVAAGAGTPALLAQFVDERLRQRRERESLRRLREALDAIEMERARVADVRAEVTRAVG